MKKYLLFALLIVFLTATFSFALTGFFPCMLIKTNPPCGMPLDWIYNKLPKRPTVAPKRDVISPDSGAVDPAKPAAGGAKPEKGQGSMVAKKEASQVAQMAKTYTVPFDPFAQEHRMISSQDMVWHHPWVSSLGTGSCNPPLENAFSKMLIITYFQVSIYPEAFPQSLTIQYFLEMGEPSIAFAENAEKAKDFVCDDGMRSSPGLAREIGKYLQDNIGKPAPQPPPDPPKGADDNETLINKLIVEELGKDYYYSTNTSFAFRLRQMGTAILPALIEAAKNNGHSLIRHNAVSLLGTFDDPKATDALRLIARGTDLVSRNRAISSLVSRRDMELVPFLTDAIKNDKDKHFQSYAVFLLGRLGVKDAIPAILEYFKAAPDGKANSNDESALWAVVTALGMINDGRPEVRKVLRDIAEKRMSATKQMALFALYAMNDSWAEKELALKERGDPLKKTDQPVFYFAINMLSKDSKTNKPYLLEVAKSKNYELQLRLIAIQSIEFTRDDTKTLKEFFDEKNNLDLPPILQGYVLFKLLELEDKDIAKLSQKMIDQAITNFGKYSAQTEGGGFEGVMGLRILGAMGLTTEKMLKKAISDLQKRFDDKPLKMSADDQPVLTTTAPLVETIILELGKIKSSESTGELLKLLKNDKFPCHAEIAKALGEMPYSKNVVEALIKNLNTDNGWLRQCAYESLKILTGKEFKCDWMYDDAKTRKKTVDEWEKWWATEGSKR